jgi:hypothetical protein
MAHKNTCLLLRQHLKEQFKEQARSLCSTLSSLATPARATGSLAKARRSDLTELSALIDDVTRTLDFESGVDGLNEAKDRLTKACTVISAVINEEKDLLVQSREAKGANEAETKKINGKIRQVNALRSSPSRSAGDAKHGLCRRHVCIHSSLGSRRVEQEEQVEDSPRW